MAFSEEQLLLRLAAFMWPLIRIGALLASASGVSPLELTAEERVYLLEMTRKMGLSKEELAAVGALIGPAERPQPFSLRQNRPNPFNPSTTISYAVSGKVPVGLKLEIFNLRGQMVKLLADKVQPPGEYRVSWDGKNARGREVPSGVYFYKLKAGKNTCVKKMVALR